MVIDVFHDTACPWCYIGKRNLLKAIEQWDGETVQVNYHPFFLNASIPPEGYDFKTYMQRKIGAGRDIEAMFDAPRRAGLNAGIRFNFEGMQLAVNTLDSHRLIAFTPEAQKLDVIDAVYKAYFEDGRNISDVSVLAEIAAACGLDRVQIEARLRSDEGREAVIGEAQQAVDLGVTGVPLFVFNNMFAASGAQPPDVMLRAMQQSVALARP
jgi:predicted DsbA family dithiol-disulfide isomerase